MTNNIKNIWILNHYAITPDMPGGTRHYDFGKELTKRGYKVTIFASSFHYTQHKELKLKKNEKYKIENIDGINFVWIKTFFYKKNDWRRVINMISYMHRAYWLGRKITDIDKNIKKPDIIIGSSVHLLAVLSAHWLSKYYKAKFIMEVRDLWPQNLIDIGKLKEKSLITKALRFLEKFLFQQALKIIIFSPIVKNYLSALNINTHKTCLVPNGVDLSIYKNTISQNKNNGAHEFIVMHTGNLGTFDKLDALLKAAESIQIKQFKKIKFIFIGAGAEKTKLISIVHNLKLTNVDFLESVPKTDIPSILDKADLLLLKRDKILYGSSNKLMDYMAAGKPIVSCTSEKDITAQKANCGISVSSGNPVEIVNAIIKLYKMSPEEREKMGQRGREYVEKYHSIPVLVDKLEKVFKEVMKN